MEAASSNDNVTINTGFSRNPVVFNISCAIAAVMFLLPFAEIRCNGVALTKATGTDLAFGFEMKQSKTINNWNNTLNWNDDAGNLSDTKAGRKKKEPNSFALAAFVLAVAGLGFSFLKFRQKPLISMVIGVLGVITMIGLMIQLKTDLKNEATAQGADYGVKVSIDFTAWFFFALLAFMAAAFFGWRQMKPDKPPATASSE